MQKPKPCPCATEGVLCLACALDRYLKKYGTDLAIQRAKVMQRYYFREHISPHSQLLSETQRTETDGQQVGCQAVPQTTCQMDLTSVQFLKSNLERWKAEGQSGVLAPQDRLHYLQTSCASPSKSKTMLSRCKDYVLRVLRSL